MAKQVEQDQLYIGIDGGGTKCRATIYSAKDGVLGTGLGGAVGGIGLTSALGKHKNNPALRWPAEIAGNFGGDMVGQMASDAVLRAKGGGTTPWEKLQQEGDQQYRTEIERQMLAQLGIGGYNQTDLIG